MQAPVPALSYRTGLNGQFRVVQPEMVLADIRQIAAGAEHITFGDPDFLNGPTHACSDRRCSSTLSSQK